MRGTGAFVVVVFAASACAAAPTGPADPATQADLRGVSTAAQAQVRSAAVSFVDAYRATVLGGDDLEQLAATPLMRRFAYWLAVTNGSFPGEVSAASTVQAVGQATVVEPGDGIVQVELSATVDVVAQPPEGGEPLQLSIPLDGPVRLAATEPGAWRVVDFVRFGVPMSGAFVPLDLEFERPGVRVILDSFGSVPTWSFFVRISATGPRVLSLAEDDVTLVDARGKIVASAIEVSPPLLQIAPGGHVDGALSFEPQQEPTGLSLRIDIEGPDAPAPLEIPLRTLTQAGDTP
jgi:hypothetical protein